MGTEEEFFSGMFIGFIHLFNLVFGLMPSSAFFPSQTLGGGALNIIRHETDFINSSILILINFYL